MSAPLVLSLFPGIGLLDRAFEEEGFCVVRGPDLLWGGDVRRFHAPAGRFDGVIGGPPCQLFSPLQRLVEHNRAKRPGRHKQAENLIPEFTRIVGEARPAWFLMENVPAAPQPDVSGYVVHAQLVNNRWCGGVQNRVRRFSFGTPDGRPLHVPQEALEPVEYVPAVCASGSRWQPAHVGRDGKRRAGRVYGDRSTRYLQQAIRAQGLPDGFDLPGFTVREKVRAVGNGVPLPMGRALARAVRAALTAECAMGAA